MPKWIVRLLLGIFLAALAVVLFVWGISNAKSNSSSTQNQITDWNKAFSQQKGALASAYPRESWIIGLGHVRALHGKWTAQGVLFTPEFTAQQLSKECYFQPIAGHAISATGIPSKMSVPWGPDPGQYEQVDISIKLNVPTVDALGGELIRGRLKTEILYCVRSGDAFYVEHENIDKQAVLYVFGQEDLSRIPPPPSFIENVKGILIAVVLITAVPIWMGGMSLALGIWRPKILS